jgi:hypothetical protein
MTAPPRNEPPVGETGGPGADSGQSASSPQSLVDLVLELRPDIPLSIAESLVREALDNAADAILDAEWARTRARLYAEALRLAHGRHMTPYAIRRARELAEARLYRPATFVRRDGVFVYRSADFHGRVACRCSRCLPLDLEGVA